MKGRNEKSENGEGGENRKALAELTHLELIQAICENPEGRACWDEFYCRFHGFIENAATKLCRQLGYQCNAQSCLSTEDIVQNIYQKLLQNDLRALRAFKGGRNASFYKYVLVIIHNEIINQLEKKGAAKRPEIVASLDDTGHETNKEESVDLSDRLRSFLFDAETMVEFTFLEDEIEQILREEVKGANKERDIVIFRLALYSELRAEEIARLLETDCSAKRIGNIISDIKYIVKKRLLDSS